jgi:hypothetical protein
VKSLLDFTTASSNGLASNSSDRPRMYKDYNGNSMEDTQTGLQVWSSGSIAHMVMQRINRARRGLEYELPTSDLRQHLGNTVFSSTP